MTNKITPTPDQIKRGMEALFYHQGTTQELIEAVLSAALNPPPEPEIEVSHEMSLAGIAERGSQDSGEKIKNTGDIYRAMERQRIKDAKDQPAPTPARENRNPYRVGDITMVRGVKNSRCIFHRRKDDPS